MFETLNILVVDDSDLTRFAVGKIVRDMGVKKITFASNGSEAMQKLLGMHEKASHFDLILLDWNMPVSTGMEFLKKLKALKSKGSFSETKVIMVTAESTMEQVLEALSNGAADYVVKPVKFDTLKSKMTTLLTEKKAG